MSDSRVTGESGEYLSRIVLLVEDNPVDARIFEDALVKSGMSDHVHLFVVDDFQSAMAFLRQEGKYRNAPRPDMVFADYYIPGGTGIDIIEALESSPRWEIPSVLLSGPSFHMNDIAKEAHVKGATLVLNKEHHGELPDALRVLLKVAVWW